ncbi:DUF3899 domain-containing protein [Vagococcus acidifermentans]|uniref:DUF3899 domain-containing protein n=1 Tax=Vagococcus acidifermentans TaxID=564710 RepID=A0A430AWQ7_9ENTE|nr:DUF3899 domain-containing protein [Vagococcus acidifermentans]RSU12501.1 hypothetical protein CBF27_05880 [Vagococcus acidifermentans]
MKRYQRVGLSFAVISCGVIGWHRFIARDLTVSTLADSFFLIALVYVMIFAFIAVLSSGFFDAFQHSIKQALKRSKQAEPPEYLPLSQVFSAKGYYFLLTGLVFLGFSLFFLLI